jgi:type I restriction enzyme S subunit
MSTLSPQRSDSDLQNGWRTTTVGEVVDNYDGRRRPVKSGDRAKRQGQYAYYGASGIIDSVDDYLFEGTYLLVAEDGANLLSRSTPIAFTATGRFWVNNHAHILKTKAACGLDYLQHYLNWLNVAPFVTGSAQPKLTQKALNRIPLPLPPLNEQHRMVAKVDSIIARSKKSRSELVRIPVLAERYKHAILAAAFRGDLTTDWRIENDISFDDDWSTTTLGDLCNEVRYGTAAKCSYESTNTPVLRIPNVVKGHIDINDLKYGRFNKKEIEKLALRSGDLLVIRSNGSLDLVGRAALATDEVAGYLFAGYLIRLRLDSSRVNPAFALLGFEEPAIRQTIENLAKSTSGVNNINSEQLKTLRLPVPSQLEQCEIVRRVERAFARIDQTAAQAARATRLLDRLDQATLSKAFRGELVSSELSLKY